MNFTSVALQDRHPASLGDRHRRLALASLIIENGHRSVADRLSGDIMTRIERCSHGPVVARNLSRRKEAVTSGLQAVISAAEGSLCQSVSTLRIPVQ